MNNRVITFDNIISKRKDLEKLKDEKRNNDNKVKSYYLIDDKQNKIEVKDEVK